VLAAAMKEGWSGPVFIQGDHFQFNAKRFTTDPDGEIQRVQALTKRSIDAGFYNIDIDASTLVDLTKPIFEDQQRANCRVTAEMTRFIRSVEPEGVTVSIGGEIGEVGGRNSTVDELRTFMDGYIQTIATLDGGKMEGISKISVQTGTVHGGVPLPDGKVADVAIDFKALDQLSAMAITAYKLGGAVQHGASTLPETMFERFPQADTAEIHLATAFQNMVYESRFFPGALYREISEHLKTHHSKDWQEGETEEQFLYKSRKRGFGPFKRKMWDLPEEIRGGICDELEKRFDLIFRKLGAVRTIDAIVDNVDAVKIPSAPPEKFSDLLRR
jgi:fructose/tagatose bisphosphate aldolase